MTICKAQYVANCYKSANIVSMHVVTDKKTVQTGMISDVFEDIVLCKRANEEQAVDCSRLAEQLRFDFDSTAVRLPIEGH